MAQQRGAGFRAPEQGYEDADERAREFAARAPGKISENRPGVEDAIAQKGRDIVDKTHEMAPGGDFKGYVSDKYAGGDKVWTEIGEDVRRRAGEASQVLKKDVEAAKSKSSDMAHSAAQKASELGHEVEEKAGGAFETAKEKVEGAVDKTKHAVGDTVESAKQKVGGVVDATRQQADFVVETAKEKVRGAADTVADVGHKVSDKTGQAVEAVKDTGSAALQKVKSAPARIVGAGREAKEKVVEETDAVKEYAVLHTPHCSLSRTSLLIILIIAGQPIEGIKRPS